MVYERNQTALLWHHRKCHSKAWHLSRRFCLIPWDRPLNSFRKISREDGVYPDILEASLNRLTDHGMDIMDALKIDNERDFYYHATNESFSFPVDVHMNDGKENDFGNGFYLGESLRQSSTWGKLGTSTRIYRFAKSRFAGLSFFDFNDGKTLDWLNYIAINRKKINPSEYPPLIEKHMKKVEGFDVIRGKIADSFSFHILEKLFVDLLDVDQAEYCTVIMALGNQLCLKNQEFASKLEADELIIYDSSLSDYFLNHSKKIQEKQDANVDKILSDIPDKSRLWSRLLKEKYDR